MKKLLLSLLVFLVIPITAIAEDVNYDIESYYIDAQILANGDVAVSEIFLVNGSLNGYEMNLSYVSTKSSMKADNISDIKVSGLKANRISYNTFYEEFESFDQVTYAEVGEDLKYSVDTIMDGYSIRMYHPLNKGKYVFRLDYTINGIVTMHDDFAEFYWNFFSGELADEIGNLNIRVTLPSLDNSDYFRFWAHGPLEGEINEISSNTNSIVYAEIPSLESYGTLDIRITFAKNLVNNITKYSSQSFADIIDNETFLAEEANAIRKEIRGKMTTAIVGTVIFYVALVGAFIFVYIKYDRERKPMFKLKYNREFIDDYNVEVIDYLLHRQITENALSASIMNLVYKKNIKVEAIPEVKDEYRFTLISRDKLNDTENSLVDFLFNNVAKGTASFTTTTLKKYASNTKTCQTFMNSYTNWKTKVIKDGEAQEFFEKKKKYLWIPLILLVFSILLITYIAHNNIEFIPGIVTILFAIIFMIYVISFSKKTKKGIEHYARWMAFKKFLNDFGNFSIKELPEIVLWERYLVYATIFGLADKVEKVMNVRIAEFSAANMNMDYYTVHYITNIHISNVITSSMHSAINTSQMTINRMNASSRMSSGSGFGGGFSSGGGFGGGGRSGGGF